jgi:methylmalonyl-CoA/ethylmalonyl-CoA epimerase
MTSRLDHVALLVTDLARASEVVRALGVEVEAPADFPAEGTREAYCGPADAAAKLLLLQPLGPGPYARALERRGPGLHHVAIATPDPRAFAEAARGWLLHPRSLRGTTLWLARPGVGTLVEVTEEKAPLACGPAVVERVEIPGPAALLAALGLPALVAGSEAWLTVAGRRVRADLS